MYETTLRLYHGLSRNSHMVVAQETKWKVDWTRLIQPTEALEWCKPMPCLCCVLSSLPWGEKHEPPPICFRSRVSSQVLLMDSQSSFLSALFSPCLAFCADLSSLVLVPDGFWLLSVSYVCQSNHWEPLQHIKFMKYKHKLAQANIMDQYLTVSRLLKKSADQGISGFWHPFNPSQVLNYKYICILCLFMMFKEKIRSEMFNQPSYWRLKGAMFRYDRRGRIFHFTCASSDCITNLSHETEISTQKNKKMSVLSPVAEMQRVGGCFLTKAAN